MRALSLALFGGADGVAGGFPLALFCSEDDDGGTQ